MDIQGDTEMKLISKKIEKKQEIKRVEIAIEETCKADVAYRKAVIWIKESNEALWKEIKSMIPEIPPDDRSAKPSLNKENLEVTWWVDEQGK